MTQNGRNAKVLRLLLAQLCFTPVELSLLYPWTAKTWRTWYERGRLEGARKVHGKILIPMSTVQAMMSIKQPLAAAYKELAVPEKLAEAGARRTPSRREVREALASEYREPTLEDLFA